MVWVWKDGGSSLAFRTHFSELLRPVYFSGGYVRYIRDHKQFFLLDPELTACCTISLI